MTSSVIVNRYANALVDVVLAPGAEVTPAEAAEQLRSFSAALQSSPELRLLMASPAVARARKRIVIRRIAETLQLGRVARNFLLVLLDHARAVALPEMIDAFEVIIDERLGFIRVAVRSATELSAPQQEELAGHLAKLAGKQVRLRPTVDPQLIGGVTARIGSKVYDGSVQGRLAGMRRRLAATV
jgi:F-type H+-transporting ATPase subunit delta